MKTKRHTMLRIRLSTPLAIAAACALALAPVTPAAAARPALGEQQVSAITLATQSGAFQHPLDSTPDLSGTSLYFTATGPHGPGIFRVPTAGGAATELYAGSPFVRPRAIAMSPDGHKIFVTDPAAAQGAGTSGAIFVLPLGAKRPVLLAGSLGTAPQNLDVENQAGKQVVYFSGKDPSNGLPAVLTLPLLGAPAPIVVVEGTPLVSPDGVAVTHGGVVYVADRAAAGHGLGKIFRISGGAAIAVVNQVRTGSPAGIALTRNDAILLVSALQLHTPNDQVLLVDLATLRTGSVTKVVSHNHAAGGLHAQPMGLVQMQTTGTQQLFSWCDLTGGRGHGGVYTVEVV